MRAQRREHSRERIGSVRVIDNDRGSAAGLSDEFEPAWDAAELGERRGRRRRWDTGRNRQTECAECVHRLEFAEQRQQKLVAPAEDLEDEAADHDPTAATPQSASRQQGRRHSR